MRSQNGEKSPNTPCATKQVLPVPLLENERADASGDASHYAIERAALQIVTPKVTREVLPGVSCYPVV